jgi:hypothetical protein
MDACESYLVKCVFLFRVSSVLEEHFVSSPISLNRVFFTLFTLPWRCPARDCQAEATATAAAVALRPLVTKSETLFMSAVPRPVRRAGESSMAT